MQLKPGLRLYSAVSPIEMMVVRAPAGDVELTCGGVALQTTAGAVPGSAVVVDGETLIGKRYVDEESGLEVLCVKGGAGVVSIDSRPVVMRSAKPLPASD